MNRRDTKLADRRALAFPDEPYSAYCRVCWEPVYRLWIAADDHHSGVCPDGHGQAVLCPNAMAAAGLRGQIADLRRRGIINSGEMGDG